VARTFLTEWMWARMEPLLPSEQGGIGHPRLENRPIVETILWKHRTGAPWRDLPESFGPWNTVFTRFNRWNRSGVWQRVLETVRGEAGCEWVMVDGTVIRAQQHAAGAKRGTYIQALGRSRGGFSTKVHLMGDAQGNPVDFVLTPGQSHERPDRCNWSRGSRSAPSVQERSSRLRCPSLQGPPRHREPVREAQAIPKPRDPLRQNHAQLQRHGRHRLCSCLAPNLIPNFV
jgi:transposase